MNRILACLCGLSALAVSMFATAQTAGGEAKLSHSLPLLIDGGGYRSILMVTNVADHANRCTLNLLDNRLAADSFETHENLTWRGNGAILELPNPGSHMRISGRNLASSEVHDSGVLECDLPAVVRIMVTLSRNNAVAAAAVLPSAQTGERFRIPVLRRFGDYLFAAQNRQAGAVNCRIELLDESGAVVAARPHDLAGSAAVVGHLSDLAPMPANFAGGSAAVSCDGQIAVTGLLAGAALSGLPPAVLSGGQAAAGFAPGNAAAFNRVVVGRRLVSVGDSRYYTEFPAAGQFVEVEPGARFTGTYTYRNTGPDTGTLTLNYSGGLICTYRLTLTSAATGSSQATCNDGTTGRGNWRLGDAPPATGGGDSGGGNTEIPMSPTNVQYVRDGSAAVVSWDVVRGADYYKIYHDDFWSSGCRLNPSGSTGFCDELAANVTGTSYTHANPDDDQNYYWVVACTAGGCSDIGADPAAYIDTRPTGPMNVSYVRDGSTAVVSWDVVRGADYYRIYHDDFRSSGCRLNSSGSPSFCDELAANVTGTSYTHANPDDDQNYYWVVACAAGGCSDIGADPAAYIDTRPTGPMNVSYVRVGSTAVVSWDVVQGADYYKIYHDDFWSSGCRLNSSGSPSFCDELAANVTGTSYTHANPDDDQNYYWVVACTAGGCSDIGADPAAYIDTRPTGPMNVSYVRDGSTAVVSWDVVRGADYYKIYHDDFWSSGCRLNSSGSPSFCDELAANVTGTSYTHANPDDDQNYYWVVACTAGGCSDIGADPAAYIDTRPAAPRNVRASRNGSAVMLSWDAAAGANYYRIYHDDFWSSGCRLNSSGSPSFCDELAANVTGTSYTHANPDDDQNYYWVVACNAGGCSEIDGDNPTESGAGGSDSGGGDSDSGGGDSGSSDDHGDDRASATRVNAGSNTRGSLSVGDIDYFRIQVSGSGTLEAYTSSSIDTLGRLESAVGALVGSNDDGGSGTNFRISETVSAGAYFVQVKGFDSDETGSYTLHVRFTASSTTTNPPPGDGACTAGLVVNPGESCTYKGADFRVSSSGQGSILAGGIFLTSSTQIDQRATTVNGVRWNFHATRNTGSNSWTIQVAD